MPDLRISDDDLFRVTRTALERMERPAPPRDIEGDVMAAILAPPRRRRLPSGRLVASGLVVAAVVAAGCVALVTHLERGSTAGTAPQWSIVPGPTLPGTPYGALVGIACPGADDCWAVGSLEKGKESSPLIEHYSGGSWRIVSSPTPAGATGGGLDGVTCVDADVCWATGSSTGAGGRFQPLIERDAGSGWTVVPSPALSGGEGGALGGVSCSSSSDCWAVGNTTGTPTEPLIEHYTGTAWTIVASPAPPDATGGFLNGVTCVSAGGCWAVGTVDHGTGNAISSETTLIEHDTGDGWAIVPSPNPAGAPSETPYNPEGGGLWSVTCVNADDCWAVGLPTGSTAGARALIEQDAGNGWHIVSSPMAPGGRTASGVLNGVTCEDAGDCWAVGFYPDAGGRGTLVEQYTATGWHLVSSSDAPGAFSTLYGVACAGAGDCWAVGLTGNQGVASPKDTPKIGTLIERDNQSAG
jgi:hypothetical protein